MEANNDYQLSKQITGDINGDGKVTIDDITALTDKLLSGDVDKNKDDVNKDGKVNIHDLADLGDIILQNQSTPDVSPEDETVKVFNVDGIEFKMIKVNHGKFIIGSPSTELGSLTIERPQHEVTITNDYWIAETQVTQELWLKITGKNPSVCKGDQNPVENISYIDAKDFITKLNEKTGENFRLPTEAEWEFAARGGNESKGFIFPGSKIHKEVAWMKTNSDGKSHPVKQLKPNELGIYDMGGNVAEWTNSKYVSYTSAAAVNPGTEAPAVNGNAVYRNGGYTDPAALIRCAYRYPAKTNYKLKTLGLRLAM